MAYVVTRSCCADASCVVACPVNCIHPAPGEPGFAEAEMLYIDDRSCVGCGACVTACPVDAIVPETALRDDQRPFVALAAEYYEVFPHADRPPLAPISPRRRLQERRPRRIAVVGAGPSGLYAADELLTHPEISVDVYERREHPHGLARFGVAADHLDTRRVARLLETIERQPGFRYHLGVEIGSVADLPGGFDAVVWATGAAVERPLGVPGEELALGATTLATWANADPEHRDLRVTARTAVVVGAGNVALDTARLLTGPRVGAAEVIILGRRGVERAAFTTPELIALAGLSEVDVLLMGESPTGRGVRAEILADLARRTSRPGRPRIVLRFGCRVAAVLPDGVVLDSGERLRSDLVVGAVGHQWAPVAHDRGRIRPGEYVVGWAKRGPTGFIGTNKTCAQETIARLLDDLDAGGDLGLSGEQRLVPPVDTNPGSPLPRVASAGR